MLRAEKARPDLDVLPEWSRRIKHWGYAKLIKVATDPNTPPDALRAIARHASSFVRFEVAKNLGCPEEALAWLATDEDRNVKGAAKCNSNYDQQILANWKRGQKVNDWYDPDRMRAIYYGLNEEGARRIVENWCGPEEDAAEVLIHPDEFNRLWESGIIDDLNDHYGVLIDDYEIDAIGGDLSFALSCVEPRTEELPNVYIAVKAAYELGTALLFCF